MTRVVAAVVVLATIAMLVFDVLILDFLGAFVAIPIAVSPFALVGALLVARIPRNPVGWLLSGSGLLFELLTAVNGYAWVALVRDPGRLIDLGALEGELLAVVDETLQPARAGVWLRGNTER